MLAALLLILTSASSSQDICQLCDCLPRGDNPVQAFCVDNSFGDKEFSLATSSQASTLQLVYINGIKTVNFGLNSFLTEKPLDLLIQNCSEVNIYNNSINHLRSLVIQNIKSVKVGALSQPDLWSVILENIDLLTLDEAISFNANYTVKIGNVGSLTVLGTQEERNCFENLELQFTFFDCVFNPIPEGGLIICGNHIKLENNTFESVAEGGFKITAESSIKIVNNHFKHLNKKVFNLSSPGIYISGNNFDILPAGALSDVSTLQDTFFTNNTIQDVDLGGVLLDMGWGMTIENNLINCDCASKRTSILNPKQDMLILTNSSHEILQSIFFNNYCSLDCTVSLKDFSYALIQGDVCLTNNTRLEEEKLCDMNILPDYVTESETESSPVSEATRVELLVPLSIILISLLVISSACYGVKEMKTFRFFFNPHRNLDPKLSSELPSIPGAGNNQ
ncbi:uncharacterized protein LOC129004969 [Macrosteles quadrilineatus]|uniref:uncharacterized protein LOC129004969 n=1 Tax=Macrosteles quadrilineatus TaxID=74068 RepID=UPI0023E2E2C8|nr:uncharacterized protein LOC129004969 [Macrosteles quadrilineatus]